MMIRTILLGCIVAVVSTDSARAGPDPDLGASVRANVAAQVINMNPDYSDQPPPVASGRRTSDAMIRYQTGKLKHLLKTNGRTDLGGQGGASDETTVSIPLISTGSPN